MQNFPPDPRLPVDIVPSPNHGERRGGMAPDMLLLHYTGMSDGESALRRLCAAGTDVSSHYVVFEGGRTVQCVPEARRAWHAGEGSWAGVTDDLNSHSIGIEIVNPGHDNGYADFPPAQIDAVVALCRDILARHRIPAERVLAHSDIAPRRKQDPGEKFPWEQLHDHGIGHWVRPAPIAAEGEVLRMGDAGPEVEALQAALAGYGYGLAVTGAYGQETQTVVTAFQRHFRPQRVDGLADLSTRTTLRLLREAIPAYPRTPLPLCD